MNASEVVVDVVPRFDWQALVADLRRTADAIEAANRCQTCTGLGWVHSEPPSSGGAMCGSSCVSVPCPDCAGAGR